MSRKKQIINVTLVIIMFSTIFSLGIWKQDAEAVTFATITSEGIKQKEQQIQNAKNEKTQLSNGITDLKQIKKDLEAKKSSLQQYIAQLDSDLEQIEKNIADLKYKITVKEEEIVRTEAELEAALQNEQDQRDAMIARIRMVYETGNSQMTDMLLKSENFGDFLNKADYVERVISYDQNRWQDYKTVREYVELCKEQLEIEKELLDETKAVVEEEQASLELLIAQKETDLYNYETDINNKAATIKEYEEEIIAQEEEIAALEKAIEDEKKTILANSGLVLTYDGGKFVFPVAYYTRVSDDYGMRIHPTLHIQKFHNGVDLASPAGTAIYAAYDGVVAAATYSSTMGNYVMINHGNGLYTIYMHASKLYVKKDEIVARGDKIAAVGTTGRSTGNHLHFSVRVNGEYVSPWNYISK